MAHWYTNTIIVDLEKIKGIHQVENQGPGEDVDSDNLYLTIKGSKGHIYIAAFDPERNPTNPSDDEFTHIEVNDGVDSRGGFQTFKDQPLGQAYLAVCQYFATKGFNVVPCLKEYY